MRHHCRVFAFALECPGLLVDAMLAFPVMRPVIGDHFVTLAADPWLLPDLAATENAIGLTFRLLDSFCRIHFLNVITNRSGHTHLHHR